MRQHRIPRSSIVALAVCSLLAAAAARAEDERCVVGGENRVLNGHAFQFSQLVFWPFPTTHFGTITGVGLRTMHVTAAQDETGATIEGDLNLGLIAEGLELGVNLFDWVGLRASFGGAVAAGTDLVSAISAGAFFMPIFDGGAVVRLYRGRLLQLSAGAHASYLFGKRLDPLGMLSTLTINEDTGEIRLDRSRLLVDISTLNVGPVLAAAFAPIPLLGLQSSFAFDYGRTTVGELTLEAKSIKWAAGINLDLMAIHVPLAFPLAYQLEASVEEGGSTKHELETGVQYSGRRNLNLALLFHTNVGDVEQQYLGEFRFFYFW